jgi:4-amino-4-deoxy-L-arabinose transferase-like glycosyltransferase
MAIVGKSHQRRKMPRTKSIFLLTLILLVGAGLRFHMLTADVRLHPDEALFSTFARNAAIHGDWMLPGPLDKTPASIYASALSMHFVAVHQNALDVLDMTVRQGELAARLPNVLLGLILVSMTAATSELRSRSTAVISAVLVAFSPFALVFSAAAFTDMGMVTFGMLALLAVLRGRDWLAGIALAHSIAFKQQGVIYLPLVMALAWHSGYLSRRWLLHWGAALVLGLALLLIWDAARPETSIFTLAAENNDPNAFFAAPGEWLPRLKTWLGYAGWLLGPPLLTFPLLMMTAVHILRRGERFDRLLGGYGLTYFCLHWLIAFNTYDRYLLPLVPLLAILAARAITTIRLPQAPTYVLMTIATALLLITGIQISQWNFDLGRDHHPLDREGAIIAAADHLNQKPLATIIYDPWLGWEMDYYLGPWSNKRRVHYPTPQALVTDAVENPEAEPRYLIAPTTQTITPWLSALDVAGFEIKLDYENNRVAVYRLTPRR